MPATIYNKRTETEWTIGAEALRGRIDRYLRKLMPYRELYYDHSTRGFYVRIVESGNPQHMSRLGPYYYKDLSGLARMLHMLPQATITCIDRWGNEYPEKDLPPSLRFNVLTMARSHMIRELESIGYKCIAPNDLLQPERAPVTETVIDDKRDEDPAFGEEATEEEEEVIARMLEEDKGD